MTHRRKRRSTQWPYHQTWDSPLFHPTVVLAAIPWPRWQAPLLVSWEDQVLVPLHLVAPGCHLLILVHRRACLQAAD